MEDDYIIFYGKKIKKDVTELNYYSGYGKIIDITPLMGLHNLVKLSLNDYQIVDLTPLSGLHKLTKLCLYNDQISDLTPLSGLYNLTILYLSGNQISDLTPLSGLQNLKELHLRNNLISDLTPLSGLYNLTELYIHYNKITDLTPLAGLNNLCILGLSNNMISDLTPLSGLHNLTDLYLSFNKIICVTPLSGLHNLIELYLYNNQITLFPLSIINLTRLHTFPYDNHLVTNLNHPVISRWLNKPLDRSVYSNRENVHLTSIQTCIQTSILKLMECWSDIDIPYHDFFDDNTVYHNLGTYKEVYQAVWIEIQKLAGDYQITAKQRLQEELDESKSRCYVGKLTRLVNCLSGLSDKVSIQISKNEEISNIVIHFKSQGKERVIQELHERGYTDEEISEWIEHL